MANSFNSLFSVFNGIIPVTEIGTYTKTPRRTLSTSTTIPTTMITNLTLASPAEIAVPSNPQPRAMDGWMVLVGIIAGTIILGKIRLFSFFNRGGSPAGQPFLGTIFPSHEVFQPFL